APKRKKHCNWWCHAKNVGGGALTGVIHATLKIKPAVTMVKMVVSSAAGAFGCMNVAPELRGGCSQQVKRDVERTIDKDDARVPCPHPGATATAPPPTGPCGTTGVAWRPPTPRPGTCSGTRRTGRGSRPST